MRDGEAFRFKRRTEITKRDLGFFDSFSPVSAA
jgi:hypothetical protein